MRKKVGLVMMMAALVGVVIACQTAGEYLRGQMEVAETAGKVEGEKNAGETEEMVVVVDSGHGGKDPGKIGINGALEKDINLQIAQKVKKYLEEEKIKVVMTREEDERLSDSQVEDLKARVELINETKPALAVCIHQNSYHEEGVHGAQVFFYTHSQEGEKAAGLVQEALRAVDRENTKQAKANDTYYVLKKTEASVIIVECGFLSNYAEAEKLCDDGYQEELAAAITKGIQEYIGVLP